MSTTTRLYWLVMFLSVLDKKYFFQKITQHEDSFYKEFPIERYVKSLGYPLEIYEVETSDGYLITLHRIPHGKNNGKSQNRTPVIMMHGLFGSSEHFISMKEKSLAFMSADAGYDVWLPNARGSMHSRKHKKLNPDVDLNFWDFSWHEIGVFDLTASIDFVLEKTNRNTLDYVGYSQGCTAFMVMNSEMPKYKKKVRSFVAMAPAVYFRNFKHALWGEVFDNSKTIYDTMLKINNKESIFLMNFKYLRYLINSFFEANPNVFYSIVEYIFGESEQLNMEGLKFFSETSPSGSSVKQIIHFAQQKLKGDFIKFDYGTTLNKKMYNSTTPPLYKISKMDIPTYIFSGQNDLMVSQEDISHLIETLPNVKHHNVIPVKKFTHLDFLLGKDIDKLLNNNVIQILDKYEH